LEQYSNSLNWASLPTKIRCRRVAGVAAEIAVAADELVQLCTSDQRTDPAETIAAELLPLCSGLRFIGRRGAKILQSQRYGVVGRPAWLWGIGSTIRRDPHGRVLILGAWNYPLLLSGAQAGQALAAGNTVMLKPAVGSEAATDRMVRAFHDAGIPKSALIQLDSSTESAVAAIDAGVDLIVLTGSAATGRKVLERASQTLTPTIMELSGCDAVVVMPEADLEHAIDAIEFGLNINGGATCISPRRLIVEDSMAEQLFEPLSQRLRSRPAATVHAAARQGAAETIERAIEQGAVDRLGQFDADRLRTSGHLKPIVLDRVSPDHAIASADVFAPIISILRVDQIADAVKIVNECPYRLAASVFGPTNHAPELAARLRVGSVAINDMVVPTADPRLPFGGRGQSGFGVTRGGEGLLQMTVPTVISRRRGRFAPHLMPRRSTDAEALGGALQLLHAGSFGRRMRGLAQLTRAIRSSKPGNAPLGDDQRPPQSDPPQTERNG
jgi:acyl-CoA reductase-like NAD-dependent aldehyde dehydrogenase